MLALLAACSFSSYSEIINGVTTNAAGNGLQWDMATVLPQQPGLVVNSVIYRYTTIKQQQDQMYVDIQNKNALGAGYVFNERDDWSNLPGNTITKAVPINGIPIEYWGNGEIKVDGTGSVSNAQVSYGYRYDTCFDPITDPSCPGYAAAMAEFLKQFNTTVEVKDSMDDENVKAVLNSKADLKEEEKDSKEENKKKEKEKDKKRAIALKAAESAVSSALEISQSAMLEAMSNVPNFEAYYISELKGGAYPDAQMYKETKVPENRRGLRMGLAQQIKHDTMVDQQYKTK